MSVSMLNTQRSSTSRESTPVMTTTSFCTSPRVSQSASCRSTCTRYVLSPSSLVTSTLKPYLGTDVNESGG